jgi:hypothetical protein
MAPTRLPKPDPASATAMLSSFFRKNSPRIAKKVELQVRRTSRRQTGPYKTNRATRWTLNPDHPDYTAIEQIPLIEAKLYAMALEFDGAPTVPEQVRAAASTLLGKEPKAGAYRCPVTGRPMSFAELLSESDRPTPGRSSFHVGHILPKAMQGANTADNPYWTTSLGNRIQGDRSWHETVKIIVEMGEFHRKRHGDIPWGQLVNQYSG